MPEAGLKIAQKGLKNTFFVEILPRHLVWLGYFGFCGGSNPPHAHVCLGGYINKIKYALYVSIITGLRSYLHISMLGIKVPIKVPHLLKVLHSKYLISIFMRTFMSTFEQRDIF